MAEVHMPKMGDGMEEGTINRWLVHEGDMVQKDEVIAEIETDKASVEITSYDAGILTKIVLPEGGTAPVGAVIAIIGTPAANGTIPAKAQPKPATNGGATPPAAAESVTPQPVAVPQAVPVSTSPDSERVKASPLARSIAASAGIDLARVHGTGPGGRIVERDIKEFQAKTPAAPPVPIDAPTPPRPATTAPAAPAQEIKPSRMREAIARRVVQSKQTVPHFYVTMVVEMDRAQSLLKELNADATEGKITVNDIIVKACAVALAKVPEVNATWTAENTIRRYSEAHIGVAVGIDEGLIIPVIRDCHVKTLRQISADAKSLIGKARNNQLKPEEYSGGTFSVSNLGMMGVDEFIAIINPPEAAILAIGGITRDPIVLPGSDTIVIRSRMKITISADHRLLDGVIAARFIQEVKKALEAPFSLLS